MRHLVRLLVFAMIVLVPATLFAQIPPIDHTDWSWTPDGGGCNCSVCERHLFGKTCVPVNGSSGRCYCKTKDLAPLTNPIPVYDCDIDGPACYGIIVTP